jgi:hypothetical protein
VKRNKKRRLRKLKQKRVRKVMKPQRKKQKNKFIFGILVLATMTLLAGSVLAEDLVYLVEDSNNIDYNILNILDSTEHNYDIVYDADISETNLSVYDLMIIEEGNFEGDADLIPVNEVNSIIMNTAHLEDWNWITGSEAFITSIRPSEVVIHDPQSLIVNVSGVNDTFFPYVDGEPGEDYKYYYINKNRKAPGVRIVVADDLNFLQFFGIYVVNNGGAITSIEETLMKMVLILGLLVEKIVMMKIQVIILIQLN